MGVVAQNQFLAVQPDQISTGTANTDEVLLAETTWDEVINGITPEGFVDDTSFTPASGTGGAAQTAGAKGEIFIYDEDNDTWSSVGDLTDFSGITTLGNISDANSASTFNAISIGANNIIIVRADIASGLTGLASGTSADKGDVFQRDGTDWVLRGNLSTLTPITSAIFAVSSLSTSADLGELNILVSAQTGISNIVGGGSGDFHPSATFDYRVKFIRWW